jgi:hypothetical protein
MYLERCKVSRKTAGDGKLQITATTYRSLIGAGESLRVKLQDQLASALLETMECTCNKPHASSGSAENGAGLNGAHTHFFLESPLLRALTAQEDVRLDLDGVALVVGITRL